MAGSFISISTGGANVVSAPAFIKTVVPVTVESVTSIVAVATFLKPKRPKRSEALAFNSIKPPLTSAELSLIEAAGGSPVTPGIRTIE